MADGTFLLKTGALGLDAGTGSGLKDLLGENFGGDWGQTGDATLEIVSAVGFSLSGHLFLCNMLALVLMLGTYCQSLLIWPFCRSLLRKATWQVLHVYG